MTKPTTIRIPDDLLEQIEELVKERELDRAGYLREVLMKGFTVDRQERLLQDYHQGKLSLMEICQKLDVNPWDIFSTLRDKNMRLNVDLEDWLDAADLSDSHR